MKSNCIFSEHLKTFEQISNVGKDSLKIWEADKVSVSVHQSNIFRGWLPLRDLLVLFLI